MNYLFVALGIIGKLIFDIFFKKKNPNATPQDILKKDQSDEALQSAMLKKTNSDLSDLNKFMRSKDIK